MPMRPVANVQSNIHQVLRNLSVPHRIEEGLPVMSLKSLQRAPKSLLDQQRAPRGRRRRCQSNHPVSVTLDHVYLFWQRLRAPCLHYARGRASRRSPRARTSCCRPPSRRQRSCSSARARRCSSSSRRRPRASRRWSVMSDVMRLERAEFDPVPWDFCHLEQFFQ